jgi:hypothetical protein
MKIKFLALAALLAVGAQAQAGFDVNGVAYMSADGSEPWSSSSNVEAMNAAFGVGKWDRLNFSNEITTQYAMVYVDGGAAAGVDFASYIDANRVALESYVTGGGRLFLNAGTWNLGSQGNGLLFGATTTEGGSSGYSGAGQLTAAGMPLSANGAGTSWEGNWFAHNAIGTGAGFTTFITGDSGETVLAGGAFGAGYLLLGGQTNTYFHSAVNGSDPFQLRVNELNFANGSLVSGVPEPETYALMLSGLAALAVMARRRKPV